MKEVSEESRELLRQALDEAQAELSRKFEIISEIRAIESLPHIRVKNFDNTEVSERKGFLSFLHLTHFHLYGTFLCPMPDCRPRAAGRDVRCRNKGAAGPSEGGTANRAAGKTGAHPGREAEQEAVPAGAAGQHPQESTGTGCSHQVRQMLGSRKNKYIYQHTQAQTHVRTHKCHTSW